MKNEKVKSLIRKSLKETFGTSNLENVYKEMKSQSKDEWGCFYKQVELGNGLSLTYTSNDNCFSRMVLYVKGVGMTGSYSLRKKDLTRAGIQRGAGSLFIF